MADLSPYRAIMRWSAPRLIRIGRQPGAAWSAVPVVLAAGVVLAQVSYPLLDGEPLRLMDPSKWTPRMSAVVDYARRLAPKLIGVDIDVQVASSVSWPFAAAYCQRRLVLNLGRLGHRWFEGDLEPINRRALEIAKEVADETGTLFAGDICNTNIWDPDDRRAMQAARLYPVEAIRHECSCWKRLIWRKSIAAVTAGRSPFSTV